MLQNKMKEYKHILKQLKKEELEDFKQILRKSLMRISDRGYIDEEIGHKAMNILYDYSYKIKDCIEQNNIKEAINIIEATLETIGEFCIDGSNGEHGDIQDEFEKIYNKYV